MPQIKPADFLLLLEVFRFGLVNGLISRQEVIGWADEIIKKEDEPDYFFIEIALCRDKNTLLELLSNYQAVSENPIPLRVILALVYKRLADGIIAVEDAIKVIYNTNFYQTLTPYEYGWIYELDHYRDSYFAKSPHFIVRLDELTEDTLRYLSIYKDLNLDNFDEWREINCKLEAVIERLSAEKTEITAANQLVYKAEAKRRFRQRLYLRIAIYLLAAVTLIIVITTYKMVENNTPLTKFRRDLYQFSILFFFFFTCYHFVKGIYWVIINVVGSTKG